MKTLQVYHTDIRDYHFEALKGHFSDVLSKEVIEKADTYKHEEDQLRHLLGQILSRYAIYHFFGKKHTKSFKTQEKGKPYIDNSDCHFNISHSKDKVVVVVSKKQVGIDIEYLRKDKMRVARRFFSEEEVQQIQQAKDIDMEFTKYWSLKEAYLKYIGTGLTRPLHSFSVKYNNTDKFYLYSDNQIIVQLNLYHQIIDKNYHLSVCSPLNMNKIPLLEIKRIELLNFKQSIL